MTGADSMHQQTSSRRLVVSCSNDVYSRLYQLCRLSALQHTLDHPAVDIGKPIIASAVSERQSFVIPAHQMQDCRMEVMHIDPVLVDPKPMLVGRAVNDTSLDACSA